MEGYRRREARNEPAKKPEKFGGRQNFTRAMLLAALAAFNAPTNADAQQMPPGTKRAIERLDENTHRKSEVQRVHAEKLSPQQDIERFRERSVEHFKKYPDAFELINGPQFRNMLDEMETINAERVKGTRYEFKGVPTGEMVLKSKEGVHGNGIALRFYEENPDGPGLKERYVVVTARHVAQYMETPNGKEWTHHPRNVDLSAVEISREDAIMAMPLFLGRKNRSADLSGEVVSILGIDTDKEKHIPTVLSPRITQHLYDIEPMHPPINWQGETDWNQLKERRFVLLPKEETQFDMSFDTNKNGRIDGEEKQFQAAAGMSGSPLVYLPYGAKGVEFCGLFVAAGEADVEGKRYSFGYVVDQQQVWETIDALPGLDKQRNAERPQEGASEGFVTTVQEVR